ncbi:dioxygenase family protein [Actinomadura citrea]|uniref:Catechol 1,2-dioxygenase n=1 Tax=Actinomadura citrea TaxID=46158 RepID=A0A7Y9KG61_9ACTN|nr:dioxygenase [Actinomadura citrea]NYE14678.1 catechol 1,2-dioxygenase [Actinomadura citrea]GGT83669.1 6-chlorohydroxyquinol-1,2-dioxygenase [Actinomadura citrea]
MSHDEPIAEDLTRTVLARIAATPDERLREVMASLVRHLHAFARDVGLREPELMAAVRFLTETGRTCTEDRQEFVLLSDTLGLSSLVDELGGAGAGGATPSTILGPFYVPDAPLRASGTSIADVDLGGEPLLVDGEVADTAGRPLAGAVADVWQTAPNGRYDVQDPDQPRHNLRGRFRTDAEGRFSFRTVRPVSYPIPDDGPVGRLLRATGRHPWRAAHIHAIVSAPGHRSVTTTVFDAEDGYLGSDAVFGVKPELARTFERAPGGGLRLTERFTLAPLAPPAQNERPMAKRSSP